MLQVPSVTAVPLAPDHHYQLHVHLECGNAVRITFIGQITLLFLLPLLKCSSAYCE